MDRILLIGLGVCLLVLSPLALAAEWEISTLDSTGEVGKYSCLRIDPYNAPHIAYRDETNQKMKYAMFNGVGFNFEYPDGTADMAYLNAMVLDHLGKAFIAHLFTDEMDLMITQRTYSGTWETSIVDQLGVSDGCSIDLDKAEYPYIGFVKHSPDSVNVARWLGAGWTIYYVENAVESDLAAVKLDQDDIMHVAYEDTALGRLKCARYIEGAWEIDIVDAGTDVLYLEMLLDSDGYEHIMYLDASTAELRYAGNSSTGWRLLTVMPSVCAAVRSMSYCRTPAGIHHVCFYDLDGNLSYATNASGTWTLEKVDTAGDVGLFCSMDMDSLNRLHISYYDADGKNLKYAQQKLPPAVTYDLDINDTFFTAGDLFRLDRTWMNTMPSSVAVDEYILLDILQMYWFWPSWSMSPDFESWTVPVGGPTTDTILTFTWPDVEGEFSGIRFWGAFLESGTTNLLDYDMVEWGYGESPMMTLTSDAFSEGQMIPGQYTCDGSDLSPQLAWNNTSSSILSFALIVDDPDAPGGTWTHWVIYNMPPGTLTLETGVPTDPTLPDGSRQGKNSWNTTGYRGPCPPAGPAHRYFFTIYALDFVPSLAAGATKQQLLDAMSGHIVDQAQLMGKYQR